MWWSQGVMRNCDKTLTASLSCKDSCTWGSQTILSCAPEVSFWLCNFPGKAWLAGSGLQQMPEKQRGAQVMNRITIYSTCYWEKYRDIPIAGLGQAFKQFLTNFCSWPEKRLWNMCTLFAICILCTIDISCTIYALQTILMHYIAKYGRYNGEPIVIFNACMRTFWTSTSVHCILRYGSCWRLYVGYLMPLCQPVFDSETRVFCNLLNWQGLMYFVSACWIN